MADRKAGTFANDDDANAATGSTVNRGPHKTDDEANVAQQSRVEVTEERTETRTEGASEGDEASGPTNQ